MAKTEITPRQLFERRNTDDIFDRAVIIGLLRIFNRRLYYQQVWDNTEDGIQNVCVPFFYDFGGSNNNSPANSFIGGSNKNGGSSFNAGTNNNGSKYF